MVKIVLKFGVLCLALSLILIFEVYAQEPYSRPEAGPGPEHEMTPDGIIEAEAGREEQITEKNEEIDPTIFFGDAGEFDATSYNDTGQLMPYKDIIEDLPEDSEDPHDDIDITTIIEHRDMSYDDFGQMEYYKDIIESMPEEENAPDLDSETLDTTIEIELMYDEYGSLIPYTQYKVEEE